MRKSHRQTFSLQEMEPRALLSGMVHLPLPDAAVVADLAKVKADQATLKTDYTAIAPTLTLDKAAIQTAINNSSTVQAAETAYQTAVTTTQVALHTDLKAILAATTPSAFKAASAQYFSELTVATTTLKTDSAAIQTALTTDPNIIAARAQLTTDETAVFADQAKLDTDGAQLLTDVKAEYGSNAGTVITTLTGPPTTTLL